MLKSLKKLLLLYALLPAFGLSAPAKFAPAPDAPVVLVLGDSLSAAYGLPVQQGWVALLQQRLSAQGYPHRVVNASISGDTTQGGLSRLPAALKQHRPDYVLIELGGNDGLRGQPPKKMRENLARLIELSRAAGAQPLLFEMRIPSNYGADYAAQFQRSFEEVARAQGVPLVPFFLAEFAADPDAFQDDGIHPGVKAQPMMLDAAWPQIRRLLEGTRTASGAAAAP
jgi:acyl-CoA thioesterase I